MGVIPIIIGSDCFSRRKFLKGNPRRCYCFGEKMFSKEKRVRQKHLRIEKFKFVQEDCFLQQRGKKFTAPGAWFTPEREIELCRHCTIKADRFLVGF